MTLIKADITESIRTRCGFSRDRASALLESTLEIIKERLSSGEDVLIRGFGKFCIKNIGRRSRRSLTTGRDAMIGTSRAVVFKWSQVLKDNLNEKAGRTGKGVNSRSNGL